MKKISIWKRVLFVEEVQQWVTTKYINAVPFTKHMEDTLFPTGSVVFDALLNGYEGGIITTIYGPSGTGKTTTCLLAAIACIRSGKKVIFVDTEGSFSTFRFQQLLAGENMQGYFEKIFILKPLSFADQSKAMQRLKDLVNESIGLIIVDGISTLYRAELAKNEGIKASNSDLGLQLFYLNSIARKWNIPILMTNQVYADFEERDQVKMVGGDILKYGSKCLIVLEKYKTVRKAIIVKHRSQPENKMILFSIVEGGFALFEEQRGSSSSSSAYHPKQQSVSDKIAERFPELKDKKEFTDAAVVDE